MILWTQVQKWSLLDVDFSIPGGELGEYTYYCYNCPFQDLHCHIHVGPTLKLKRFFVAKKYAATIDAMYEE